MYGNFVITNVHMMSTYITRSVGIDMYNRSGHVKFVINNLNGIELKDKLKNN